jgi:hypothetical protein
MIGYLESGAPRVDTYGAGNDSKILIKRIRSDRSRETQQIYENSIHRPGE